MHLQLGRASRLNGLLYAKFTALHVSLDIIASSSKPARVIAARLITLAITSSIIEKRSPKSCFPPAFLCLDERGDQSLPRYLRQQRLTLTVQDSDG